MARNERQFRAMGCGASVIVVGAPHLLDAAVARVEELEACWSRFRADSELRALNASAGAGPVAVSPDLFALAHRCLVAWHRTGGWYDPTLGSAVVAAGYDRSFEELSGRPRRRPAPVEGGVPGSAPVDGGAPGPAPVDGGVPGPAGAGAALAVDPDRRTVALAPGAALDPGGIGKGLAADLVVDELARRGASGAMVSLGGDLRVWGRPPDGDHWTVEIEHPEDDERRVAAVSLRDGAVATSSTRFRRWAGPDGTRHHLIDPRTGAVAATDFDQVSVAAGRGWWAEALATAAIVGGSRAAAPLLGSWRAPAVLWCRHGGPHFLGGAFRAIVDVLP